jgi:hypothetical protein
MADPSDIIYMTWSSGFVVRYILQRGIPLALSLAIT